MLIDTHAHLTMDEFSGDIDNVLQRAKEAGVEKIINASFDLDSSKQAVALADKYNFIYASVGIHPHHAPDANEAAIEELRTLAKNSKVVAIGETGLDYYQNPVPADIQKTVLLKHLQLAKELDLPVILHVRDAGDDLLELIQNMKDLRAVFHCFAQDAKFAETVIKLGAMISFTATVTFKNAHAVRETAKQIPLEKIMIETDCPYLAPQALRGQRNEPSYVRYVAEKLAEVKGLSVEEVASVTAANAVRFFGLDIK